MAPIKPVAAGNVTLVDAVDHLLDRGAVLLGDATLSVADVDLVYVGINLLVSSVETMRQRGEWPDEGLPVRPRPPLPLANTGEQDAAEGTDSISPARRAEVGEASKPVLSLHQPSAPVYQLLDSDSGSDDETAQRSLVRLVLALVELLRQLVERQALRRMEGGALSDDQVERMGQSLKGLSEKIDELRTLFGLEAADLSIDLGPLGRLV